MPKKIGILWGGGPSDDEPFHDALVKQLPNLNIVERYIKNSAKTPADLAKELVNNNVDVIVASGTPAALAAQGATDKIFIVFAAVGNPNRVSGKNITGVSLLEPQSSGKRLDFLREAIPNCKTVAALVNLANPAHPDYLKAMPDAKRVAVPRPADLNSVLGALTKPSTDALIVLPDGMFHSQRSTIISVATKNKLPAMYSQRDYVAAGGLMSYGPDFPEMFRQAGNLVNTILNTGNLPPVEAVKSSELVINRGTAENLGVKIPPQAVVIG
jgi:putative ABC transport system substrate-binding protein